LTQPYLSASSASKSSALSMTSSARARPIRRTRCWMPPPPGDEAERRFRRREDHRFAGREAHVAGQHELAAGGAHAALDLGDRHQAAFARAGAERIESLGIPMRGVF
jgi:hypothetical protein